MSLAPGAQDDERGAAPNDLGDAGRHAADEPDERARGTQHRVGRLVEQGKRWTGAERAKVGGALEDRRQSSSVIGAGFDIHELDVHVGGGILAGAVAFRMFLFLVPFVYIVFDIIGLAARTLTEDPSHLARTLGIAGILASALVSTQDIGLASQLALLAGALIALVLTANSLAKTLYVVHWLVWRSTTVKPSGLRAIGVTIGSALVVTALSATTNQLRIALGFPGSVLVIVIVTAVAFAGWWWVSWQLPHAPMSPRQLIPGAVFVAVGADVMQALTMFWIGPLVARKSTTYGAVGIALAVLFWVYVFGRIIIGSAGVNATLWRRAGGEASDPVTGGC